MRVCRFITASLLVFLALAAVAAEPKVETVSNLPASVPKALSVALQEQGYGVLAPDGSLLSQIWLRKEFPVSGKKEVEGANYPALVPGTLLGVISFPSGAKDFRGQPVKPGAYSMRYELLPNDGNHMGVAPDRDFVLLAPVADDPGPTAVLSYQELMALSARVTGTNHPAVFSLIATDGKDLPRTYVDPNGYLVFAAQLPTSAGNIPFGIIVKGVSMSL